MVFVELSWPNLWWVVTTTGSASD